MIQTVDDRVSPKGVFHFLWEWFGVPSWEGMELLANRMQCSAKIGLRKRESKVISPATKSLENLRSKLALSRDARRVPVLLEDICFEIIREEHASLRVEGVDEGLIKLPRG